MSGTLWVTCLEMISPRNKVLPAQSWNVAWDSKALQWECIYQGNQTAFNTLYSSLPDTSWCRCCSGAVVWCVLVEPGSQVGFHPWKHQSQVRLVIHCWRNFWQLVCNITGENLTKVTERDYFLRKKIKKTPSAL